VGVVGALSLVTNRIPAMMIRTRRAATAIIILGELVAKPTTSSSMF
jgi:hypothetical protein